MELTKQIEAGTSGLDIIHGELKVLMYDTEQDMKDMDIDDPIYTYMEGLLDAYTTVYKLTYDVSFAEQAFK